jgi:hypothetical protein
MSWDVWILNTGGKTPPPPEQLQDSDYRPLGPAAEVRQHISALLPGVDWSDPIWGDYEGDGFSIEFNLGKNDPVGAMMLYVRGDGDPISAIVRFIRPLGWSALDCSTCEFLDLDNPSYTGWKSFQAFRDKVIETHRDEGAG